MWVLGLRDFFFPSPPRIHFPMLSLFQIFLSSPFLDSSPIPLPQKGPKPHGHTFTKHCPPQPTYLSSSTRCFTSELKRNSYALSRGEAGTGQGGGGGRKRGGGLGEFRIWICRRGEEEESGFLGLQDFSFPSPSALALLARFLLP